MDVIDQIRTKLELLEKYEQKRKEHLEVCKKYQKNRFATDEEFRKKVYDASREYQRERYSKDPEFRAMKNLKAKERALKKKESLGDEKANFQKIENEEKIQK